MADSNMEDPTPHSAVIEDLHGLEFSTDEEDNTDSHAIERLNLNPCLSLSAVQAIGGSRPYNSATTLAPYFGERDHGAFKRKLPIMLGTHFSEVYAAISTLRGDRPPGVKWPKIQEKLKAAREHYSLTVHPLLPDTRSWDVSDWLVRYVYFARLKLFAVGDPSSYAAAGIPETLHDDRAYSTWLLLYKWRASAEKQAANKPGGATKKPLSVSRAKQGGKEPPTETGPSTAQFSDDLGAEEDDNREAATDDDGALEPLGLDEEEVAAYLCHIAEQEEAAKKAVVKPTRKAHLQPIVQAAPTDTHEAFLRDFTFAAGSMELNFGDLSYRRQPRPLREMVDPVGDDNPENPMAKHFYRISGDPDENARLIGSDHLFEISRNRKVDFVDNHRIDRKNCSTHLLADYVKVLRATDNEQAEKVVKEVELAAKAGDIFAQKHLKVLRPDSETEREAAQKALSGMFPEGHKFTDVRRALLIRCSQYDKKSKELRGVMADAQIVSDITGKVADSNENEDDIVLDPKEVSSGVPVRESPAHAMSDTKDNKLVEIDTDDPAWRKRQSELLGAFVSPMVKKNEYRASLSALHVQYRSEPKMPGQTGPSLLWSQTVGIAKGLKLARNRILTGKGPRGILVADSTGLGKSNIGLGVVLAANNERAFDLNELRERRDYEGMRTYAREHPPKIHTWITDTHLLTQTAGDASNFSDTFIVYVYRNERDKLAPLPRGVRLLTDKMDIRDELFSKDNVLKAHTIVIMSKGILSARHGPRPAAQHCHESGHMSMAVAKSSMKYNAFGPTSWTKCLRGHVATVIIDEAHNIGVIDVDVWIAIRWLDPDFFVVLTATPVSWAGEKLTSLLAVLQDEDLDREAQQLLASDNLKNPYEDDLPCDDDACRFHATRAAFDHFYSRDADCVEQGRVLSLVFQKVMLRRTYQSSCETHPNGDVHSLQDLMPPSVPIRIHIENSQLIKDIWNNESADAYSKLYHKDNTLGSKNSDKLLVNGKYQRILHLGSFCALLFFATDIHDVTNNKTVLEYHQIHDNNHYTDYLYKLLQNIYDEGVIAQGNKTLFPYIDPATGVSRMPRRDRNGEIKKGEVLACFTQRSERIKLILALLADWVGRLGEKVIIWCSNPTEQEILNCILNVCGIRSVALLARYSAADKDKIIQRFKTPLAASQGRSISTAERDEEIETLLASIKQSTGLNFQEVGGKMIFSAPAPSDAIYCQCCGRIIRIGQKHTCVIVEIYDPLSFNLKVFMKAFKHALPVMIANTNMAEFRRLFPAGNEDGSTGGDTTISKRSLEGFVRLSDGTIMHQDAPNAPPEMEDAIPLEPRDLFAAIFGQLNSQSYSAVRDEHQNLSMGRTTHAVEAPINIANTPKKHPGLRGQRAYRSEDVDATLQDLVELEESEQAKELDMELEVDAAPEETLTERVKKAREAEHKRKRRELDVELGNTESKRRKIREVAVAGAVEQLGYVLPTRPPRTGSARHGLDSFGVTEDELTTDHNPLCLDLDQEDLDKAFATQLAALDMDEDAVLETSSVELSSALGEYDFDAAFAQRDSE